MPLYDSNGEKVCFVMNIRFNILDLLCHFSTLLLTKENVLSLRLSHMPVKPIKKGQKANGLITLLHTLQLSVNLPALKTQTRPLRPAAVY